MRRVGWLFGLGALVAAFAGAWGLAACSVDFASCDTYPHKGCLGYAATSSGTGGTSTSTTTTSTTTTTSEGPH